jgi:hypothetical protein
VVRAFFGVRNIFEEKSILNGLSTLATRKNAAKENDATNAYNASKSCCPRI